MRDERLAVRPPELHRPLERRRAVAVGVEKIKKTAVLGVPAARVHPADHGDGCGLEVGAAEALRPAHQEPARLEGMARVEESPGGAVEHGPVGRDGLADEPGLGVHVQQHPLDEAVDVGRKARPVVARDLVDEVEQDHRDGERLRGLLARERRAADVRGVLGPDEQSLEALVRLPRERRVARSAGKLRQGHHIETLAEDLALEGNRLPDPIEREVDPAVGANSVGAHELDARPRETQPLGAGLDGGVEFGEHPHLSSLKPLVLRRVEHLPVARQVVERAAVLAVRRVALPEGQHAVEEFGLVAGAERGEIGHIRSG